MIKRAISALLITVLLFLVSCGDDSTKYSHCEMVLPLDSDFYEIENSDFDVAYTNGVAAVAVLRLSFAAAFMQGIPETFNTDEFGRFWLRQCEREGEIKRHNGIAHCTYLQSDGKTSYFCLAAFYRTQYAYFVVVYTVGESVKNEWESRFLNYISTTYFVDYKSDSEK